jgi:hypothetical protein
MVDTIRPYLFPYGNAETNDIVATTDWVEGLVGVPDAATITA